MQKTIRKIHRKFDAAGDKLLAEAQALVAANPVNETDKIARLQKIGFTSGKAIKDAEEMFKKQQAASETIEAIEYFRTYYPSYKFIGEEQIKNICEKYGLLYGDADKYIGDIPEKNLTEIESFKLREEDYYENNSSWITSDILGLAMSKGGRSGVVGSHLFRWFMPSYDVGLDPWGSPAESEESGGFKGIIPTIMENKDNELMVSKKKKPQFKICAPQKEFNVNPDDRIKDGWKLLDDPIVIQPVKYKKIVGGLIISKWGLESQDESLVNEINN